MLQKPPPPRRLKLTKSSIDGLKAPDPSGKQTPYWDGNWDKALHGFAVLVSGVTKTKTFIAQRDLPNGKTRRVTVGAVNEITLDEARRRAADILDDMRRGIDPKTARRGAITLREALDAYLAARKDLRPASIRLYKFAVEQLLATWLNQPLREITSDMAAKRHAAIAAEVAARGGHAGGTAANVALRTLRILWNHAAESDASLPPNPVRLRKRWYDEPERSRMVLTDDLPKFHAAVCALPNPVARDYLLTLLFTGLRRSEAATLRWEEDVDFGMRVIRVAAVRTKSGRRLDLPMTTYMRDLLVTRRAVGNDGGVVFPSNSATGHIVDTDTPLNLIYKACGIKVAAHDLRRTYATLAESCDISPYALKALLSHSLGSGKGRDVTAGYIQMTPARLLEAAQKVADRIAELCGVEAPAGENVAKLG
jgi:integrase